jgi:hypothetical protein
MDEQLAVVLAETPSFTSLIKGDIIIVYEEIRGADWDIFRSTDWYLCRHPKGAWYNVWNIHASDFRVLGTIKYLSELERIVYGLETRR